MGPHNLNTLFIPIHLSISFPINFPNFQTSSRSSFLPACRSNMFLRAVNILGLQQLNGTRGLLSLAMMSLQTSSEDEECFFFRPRVHQQGAACGQPRLFLRLHPAVLRSECTWRAVRGQAL